MPTMLVTGFGPFPTVPDNPSGALARHLDGQVIDGVRIVGRQIDTSWQRAWPALAAAVAASRPIALVMLGVANRGQVEIETVAHNACRASADCDGRLPEQSVLEFGAPATLGTSLPWEALGSRTSSDAGRYLCNAVFYRAMRHLSDVPWRGFVHMPQDGTADADALIRRLARWIATRPAVPSDEIVCSSA